MVMTLEHRVAIVTGAGQGIGRVIAQTLSREGATVIINDLNQNVLDEATSEIINQGGNAIGLAADVTDEGQVVNLVEKVLMQFDHIDILVNNAALLILHNGAKLPIWEMPVAEWDQTQAVNLRGTFLCSKHVLKTMIKSNRQGLRIINISSSAAKLGGYIASSAYVASKAGIIGFTKIMAREAAPYGITVNAVAPGMIDAPMMRLSTPPEKDQQASLSVPLGRLGSPSEVAGTVLFLSSESASYITGATIDVNGGWAMY